MTEKSLTEFATADGPITVAEITESAPEHVVDALDALTAWETTVTLGCHDTALFVGAPATLEALETYGDVYPLYGAPERPSEHGIVGWLTYDKGVLDDDSYVAFIPAAAHPSVDTDEWETPTVTSVTDLTVRSHGRSELLNRVLPHLRTAITDSDWTGDGRAETSYAEWGDARIALTQFYNERYASLPVGLCVDALNRNQLQFGIARYPLDTSALLTTAQSVAVSHDEIPITEFNVEAFRRFLVDYCVTEGNCDTMADSLDEIGRDSQIGTDVLWEVLDRQVDR